MLIILKNSSKNLWKQDYLTDFMDKNIKKQPKFNKKFDFLRCGWDQNQLKNFFGQFLIKIQEICDILLKNTSLYHSWLFVNNFLKKNQVGIFS